MMTRRQAIKTTALAAAAAATFPSALAQPAAVVAPISPFALPPLPYALDALEPHIDARTMEIHHGKHHKAYVDNLNKAVAEFPDLAKRPIEDLLKDLNSSAVPEKIRSAIRNNGGGHFNHSLFWQMMRKGGGGEPKGELAKAIEKDFGSFAEFKTKFSDSAMKVFGSGWAWLTADHNRQLKIISSPNQDTTSLVETELARAMYSKRYGVEPDKSFVKNIHVEAAELLGLDVWEHAYYLKYQNKRADYIAAWWNVVNWDFVAERYAKLKG